MGLRLSRRSLLGVATVATAGTAFGVGQAFAEEPEPSPTAGSPSQRVKRVYTNQSQKAGGTWNSLVSVAGADGALAAAVEDKADTVVEAYSVNKIAVAVAVLDKVDRGLITLDQRVDVTQAIVAATGDGIFRLDAAYPSSVTLGHVLAALLTISDDTAVRLCGLVCPAAEVNQILRDKGFPNTQVVPVANPNRFFLGKTTPRETHEMLRQLAAGTLLSASSSTLILTNLRAPIAFTDGIRRSMSSDERLRIATKAGWFADGRNEAGIIFDSAGAVAMIYALFAHGQADADNFGATHPAVEARARMGRAFLDATSSVDIPTTRKAVPSYPYQPSNGG